MASEHFVTGAEVKVQIDEVFDNILIVMHKKNSMKGLLMPMSNKNIVIFEKLISDCKELNKNYDKDKKANSSFCVPDSTLSHNAPESISDNDNDRLCSRCKLSLKKVPKVIKNQSLSKEVLKLTYHGFNEDLLKKKNDLSRRGPPKVIKKEKITKKENSNNPNISRPKGLEKFNTKRDTLLATRRTTVRALKTQANEKIIGLCAKRKGLKPVEVEPELLPSSVIEEKKPKVNPLQMSDTSIYDFVDEDCEPIPIEPFKIEPKKNQQQRVQKNVEKLWSKKIVKMTLNKTVKMRPKKTGKITPRKIVKIPSKEDRVATQEYNGTKFSVNDIVWAKIPGYPFWPGHINAFDELAPSKRCHINWIGWNQTSNLPLKSLLHFRENFVGKYSSKLKSLKYKMAVELACKELGIDWTELMAEVAKKSQDRNSGKAVSCDKRRSIDLDEIFTCKDDRNQNLSEIEAGHKSCTEDEDTDEEEKARSALITVESLEANNKLSGLIYKVD